MINLNRMFVMTCLIIVGIVLSNSHTYSIQAASTDAGSVESSEGTRLLFEIVGVEPNESIRLSSVWGFKTWNWTVITPSTLDTYPGNPELTMIQVYENMPIAIPEGTTLNLCVLPTDKEGYACYETEVINNMANTTLDYTLVQ